VGAPSILDVRAAAAPGALSPLETTALTIANLGTGLTDENLAGFFDENVRPDPHLLVQLEFTVAASVESNALADLLANDPADLVRDVDAQEQADLERGIQASLGLDSSAANDDGASTSNRAAGQSGSPPKRARMDVGGGAVRATCASTAAARLAAETAAANATAGVAPPGVAPRPATAAAVLPGIAHPGKP
jgi:hypothetical protein